MMISKKDFLAQGAPITFIGMSGVGKTYISNILSQNGWHHYSCDYEIGTTYLSQDIKYTLNIDENITKDNIDYLSEFVGQVGRSALGGLPLYEFSRRQKLYYEAELQSIQDACDAIESNQTIINSSGSLCEIKDEALLKSLAEKTLFVYIKASEKDKINLLNRAQKYPKPLFFPPHKLEGWLSDYLKMNNISTPDDIRPNDFSRWVFPKLLSSRLPKYERLADLYGITIPAAAFEDLESSEHFNEIISGHLS